MALQAYIDGSGSRSHARALVLSGFIAPAENWAAFSEEWQAALDRPPKLDYFKMNDAVKLKGLFYGRFTEHERDERLKLLYGIIEDHITAYVSCVMPFAAFDAAVSDLRPDAVKFHPYHLALVSMVGDFAAGRGRPMGIDERVDFIFDEEVMERTALLEN